MKVAVFVYFEPADIRAHPRLPHGCVFTVCAHRKKCVPADVSCIRAEPTRPHGCTQVSARMQPCSSLSPSRPPCLLPPSVPRVRADALQMLEKKLNFL
jgi:hypothetical protein